MTDNTGQRGKEEVREISTCMCLNGCTGVRENYFRLTVVAEECFCSASETRAESIPVPSDTTFPGLDVEFHSWQKIHMALCRLS